MKKFLTISIIAIFTLVSYGADCKKLEIENIYRDTTVYFGNTVGNAADSSSNNSSSQNSDGCSVLTI